MAESVENIVAAVRRGERLTFEQAQLLWHEAPLWLLGDAATAAKRRVSGDKVYYNRNFHIEPTNICIYNCRFCSYRKRQGEAEAWEYTLDDVERICRSHAASRATEVHIVGGVHPDRDSHYYAQMIRRVRKVLPDVAVKGFTAVEINYMAHKSDVTVEECLRELQEAGLVAMPGGGAEIFDEKLRADICPDKCSSAEWLTIHRAAHELGIKTNATMLYGHVETIEQRIDHLLRLRALQDVTGGFNAFIPLKYRCYGNAMSQVGEVSVVEDMRTLAMSRLLLDNVPHIKAYWVMYGKTAAEMALAFGADDIDGTIDDSTKIYSMAGAEETAPRMSVEEMERICSNAGMRAVERDTLYNEL